MAHAPRRHAHRSIGAKALGLLIACGLLAAVNVAALGADEKDDQPETVELRVTPAQPPYRALRDHLLPTQIELTPGDAAPLYLKACLMMSEPGLPDAGKIDEEAEKWLRSPLAELPLGEAPRYLNSYRQMLDLVKIAARRERCDWDTPIREEGFVNVSLPELQPLRRIGQLVALDARLKFVGGDRAGGIDSLRTGLALARHLSKGATLINGIVGAVIAESQLGVLREALQSDPDNFFWVLADLPTPLIDLRLGFDCELDGAYWFLPALRGVATAERSPAQWRMDWEKLLEAPELAQLLRDITPKVQLPKKGDAATTAAMLARAKAIVVKEGWSAEKIASCCDAQLLLVATALGYEHFRDEAFKPTNRWASDDERRRIEADSDFAHAREEEVLPVGEEMVPAVRAALRVSDRLQRLIAALATVEALRLYAAEHDGHLPAALADIKATPIPNDPITGAPLHYVLAENVATLSALPPPGSPAETFGIRWRIQVAK